MPFPFGKSHKCPADIVKNLKDNMTILEKQDISDKKAEKVLKTYAVCKEICNVFGHVLWLLPIKIQ